MHLKGFLFSIGRKGIKRVVLNNFLLQLFLILYTPKHIYAFGEKKSKTRASGGARIPSASAIIHTCDIFLGSDREICNFW